MTAATQQTGTLPADTSSSIPWRLLTASFLALYVELLLIRWMPSVLHILAFFNNLVLIACFLGMGIGMARPAPVAWSVWQAFFRLAILMVLLAVLNSLNLTVLLANRGDVSFNEDSVRTDLLANPFVELHILALLIPMFLLVAWTTMPFGQLVAAYFDGLPRIRAYSINIGGSLFGVLAFFVVAWLQLPPLAWFAGAIAVLWSLDRQPKHLLPAAVILGTALAQYAQNYRGVYWSPYYKVAVTPMQDNNLNKGFSIDVNNQFLLFGLDLRDGAVLEGQAEGLNQLKSNYNFPFQVRPARRVLVLGAGAGNDVAAALRNGAEHVTAVEIDPVVLRLGREYHPEKPYADPRVTVVYDDARRFLNRTHDSFDLIIFATLDAHGLFSSLGSVRLESFIYTQESLEAARRHLAGDGLMILTFGPFREEVQYRQYAMVRSVFGQEPLYLNQGFSGLRTIVAGNVDAARRTPLPPGWKRIEPEQIEAKLRQYPDAATPATDDWPHLYLRKPGVPREYLGVLAGIVIVSLVLVRWSFRGTHAWDGHFFFLGAGFLLLETKSITEAALLIGSTWQVNSLVFIIILLTILLANLLVLTLLRRVTLPIVYLLLGASLLAGYFWPIGQWAAGATWQVYVLAAAYVSVPIFLAAIVFASTFKVARLGSAALASNLLGAVLGGATEYLSLAFGIRALSLLALLMYVGSFLFWYLPMRSPKTREEAQPAESLAH